MASGKANDYQRSDDDKRRPCQVRCARSLPLDAPEPVERRGNVIPAVRGVGAALECGVGARKGSCKPNELRIPTTATKATLRSAVMPRTQSNRRFQAWRRPRTQARSSWRSEHRGEKLARARWTGQVQRDRSAIRADGDGERQNRQHCRSASTVRAISARI